MGGNKTYSVDLVADYICAKALDIQEPLSVLKLHKLLYYVQAWHLALFDRPLIDTKFEAWVHGPVSRQLFSRFREIKSMYDLILRSDLRYSPTDLQQLDENAVAHIDSVLEVYMKYTGSQLEQLSHMEDPWKRARGDLPPFERCEVTIDENEMKRFYQARAAQQSA